VIRIEPAGEYVLELVLDRPAALNAVSLDTHRAFVAAAASIRAADPRAVVISSACPRAFCVGADLTLPLAERIAARPLVIAGYAALRDLPMPVVAAVHGYALGGGFELALGCDVVVADETAIVGLPEVGLGIVPGGGGTALLSRRLGPGRAAALILAGRRLDATSAYQLGCIDVLTPPGGARAAALDLAAEIAAKSPTATRAAKAALRAGLPPLLAAEDAAWRHAASSPDAAEGIAAFAAGRAPVWR
jgi:enoyl-CoA hydratase/carnithine racemase